MVKQTKTFKKGNVTKKALSAILAASMVMTSSSFVMAAPADVDVVVEGEAVDTAEEVAVGAEEAEAVEEASEVTGEENVGTMFDAVAAEIVGITNFEYTGARITPEIKVTAHDPNNKQNVILTEGDDYTVDYSNNQDAGTAAYTVKLTNVHAFSGDVWYGSGSGTGKNNTFTITKRNLNDGNLKVTYDIAANDGYAYTGKKQCPTITSVTATMTDRSVVTLNKDDFEVVRVNGPDDNMVAVGQYTVGVRVKEGTATAKNFAMGSGYLQQQDYYIGQSDFNKNTVSVTARNLPYNTAAAYTVNDVKKYLTVKNIKGTEITDYDLQIFDANGNAVDSIQAKGTYKIAVSSKKNDVEYRDGTIDSEVTIGVETLADIMANAKINMGYVGTNSRVDDNGQAKKDSEGYYVSYNGVEQYISGISADGVEVGENFDFKPVWQNEVTGKDAGDVLSVLVEGKGEYEGQTVTMSVTIRPQLIVNKDGFEGFIFTAKVGKSHWGTPSDNATLSISHGNKNNDWAVLREGKDYTYTTDKASGNVIITGKGNYTTVNPDTGATTLAVPYTETTTRSIADPSIVGTVSGTYTVDSTRTQITPDIDKITLVEKNGTQTYTLQKGIDYKTTLTYGANNAAGKGIIFVTGMGEYTGTRAITFNISGKDLAKTYKIKALKDLTVDEAALVKDGDNKLIGQTPSVVYATTGNDASKTLTYDVKYYKDGKELKAGDARFKKAGTITVEVVGKGLYEGKLTTTYNVIGTDIAKVAKADAVEDQKYTGSAITPFVKVKLNNGGSYLKNGVDYKITYENNVEVGTAHATITGIGQYSGQLVVPFKIVGQMEQDMQLLAVQVRDIQNRTLNSKPTVVKFEAGKDAKTTKSYASSDENVVKVDETGKITYTGLGEATITVKAAATEKYKAAEATMTVKVGLAKPSFTPFSKNNAFTLTSSTVKGAEKFEVQYATKKDFSNKKSVKFTATSGKVRQVKVSAADKKTYYVRVRAISGTETSAWSATKTVATK